MVAACVEAGVPEAEARAVVEDSSVGLLEVKGLIREQVRNGVDAVPFVVIEGRRRDLTLVGAKGEDEYGKALRTVVRESK